MKKKALSFEAQKLWGILTDQEKQVIQKDYPFKKDRNDLMKRLHSHNITHSVLAEISGLSLSQAQRIAQPCKTDKSGIDDLIKILKPYKGLIKALNDLLNN